MPFHPFSQEHLVTVLIGAVAGAAFLMAGRRGGNARMLATALLAFLNLSACPLSFAAWHSLGRPAPLDNLLPFQLCDIASMTAGFALLTKRHVLCTLTYFWGLAATMQALVTPAIDVGFPAWTYVMFFVQHFAIVIAALYLPVVVGWRPKQPLWRSPLEVYGWSVGYLVFSLSVNLALHTNFGFSLHAPPNPSMIDFLGPWPWYLFSMQGIAVAMFFLLALPLRRRSGK